MIIVHKQITSRSYLKLIGFLEMLRANEFLFLSLKNLKLKQFVKILFPLEKLCCARKRFLKYSPFFHYLFIIFYWLLPSFSVASLILQIASRVFIGKDQPLYFFLGLFTPQIPLLFHLLALIFP